VQANHNIVCAGPIPISYAQANFFFPMLHALIALKTLSYVQAKTFSVLPSCPANQDFPRLSQEQQVSQEHRFCAFTCT
jgi:hypothetical protein